MKSDLANVDIGEISKKKGFSELYAKFEVQKTYFTYSKIEIKNEFSITYIFTLELNGIYDNLDFFTKNNINFTIRYLLFTKNQEIGNDSWHEQIFPLGEGSKNKIINYVKSLKEPKTPVTPVITDSDKKDPVTNQGSGGSQVQISNDNSGGVEVSGGGQSSGSGSRQETTTVITPPNVESRSDCNQFDKKYGSLENNLSRIKKSIDTIQSEYSGKNSEYLNVEKDQIERNKKYSEFTEWMEKAKRRNKSLRSQLNNLKKELNDINKKYPCPAKVTHKNSEIETQLKSIIKNEELIKELDKKWGDMTSDPKLLWEIFLELQVQIKEISDKAQMYGKLFDTLKMSAGFYRSIFDMPGDTGLKPEITGKKMVELKNLLAQLEKMPPEINDLIQKLISQAKDKYNYKINQQKNKTFFNESIFKDTAQINNKIIKELENKDITKLKILLSNLKVKENFYIYYAIGILVFLLFSYALYKYLHAMKKRNQLSIRYFKQRVAMWFRKLKPRQKPRINPDGDFENENDHIPEDIEVISDISFASQGQGLDHITRRQAANYFSVSLEEIWEDTAVKMVFIKKDCIIKIYRYLDDLQMSYSDPDQINEHGGFLIGRWDYNPGNSRQYDLSIEDFIIPGEDAVYSKYNIDFKAGIHSNLYQYLANYKSKGFECIMNAWIHTHPGHSVFLSTYDLNSHGVLLGGDADHKKRNVALVVDPRTEKWDLCIFSYKQSIHEMNNSPENKKMLSFEEIYKWAVAAPQIQSTGEYFSVNITPGNGKPDTVLSMNLNFMRLIRRFIEDYQLKVTRNDFRVITGNRTENSFDGQSLYLMDLTETTYDEISQNDKAGKRLGFFILNETAQDSKKFFQKHQDIILDPGFPMVMIYSYYDDCIYIFILSSNQEIPDNPFELPLNEILKYKNR